MYKKRNSIISLLLCLCILSSLIFPVLADETEETELVEEIPIIQLTISSTEDFLTFAENCRLDSYSQNLAVSLEADIDLSGTDFTSVPIFCGTFDGNYHTISGLELTQEGSVVGLFRYLTETAAVSDLTVSGSVTPQGSRSMIGGIAGSNAGTIDNCDFFGTVSGSDSVGGLVGINTVTGIIHGSAANGLVYGSHFVGGLAGENAGVIRYSVNSAEVNTTPQQNTVEISDITMETLTDSETASTVTDIGGIAGSNSGVIRSCDNLNNVGYQHMGYNIGGIAGSQTGYIYNCKNSGQISGRKEVGGIVGQMEPVAKLEYSIDTLQILEEQLNTLSGLTNAATANAQSNASNVSSQIAALNSQVEDAKDAVKQLLPDAENPDELPTLPDMDSLLAAQNNLSQSLSGMNSSLNGIASSIQDTTSTLYRDMQAVFNQIGVMGETINGASENLGGTIADVSDADTPEDISGKVEACSNTGAVLADINVGGITGTISFENDLDPESDLTVIGDTSLNFEGELRAVVLDCENTGSVTATKQNAGGIIGLQMLGLVRNCLNIGTLDSQAADYVGGIAGSSSSYIRSSSATCVISGSSYVGGIAGSGVIVTDCRSMVRFQSVSEKVGEIMGLAEENHTEEEAPVTGNYYLPIDQDVGAVDGISYSGQAEPLEMEAFLALDGIEDVFKCSKVTFVLPDETRRTVTVATTDHLSEADIPSLPEIAGHTASWEGLDALNEEGVYFDAVLYPCYTPMQSTIQNGTLAVSDFLLEGTFEDSSAIGLQDAVSTPLLEERQTLAGSWSLTVPESQTAVTAYCRIPDGYDATQLQLWLLDSNGIWQQTEFTVNGSYAVFAVDSGETQIALIHTQPSVWPLICAAAGIVILVTVICITVHQHKKRKKATST